MSEEIPLKKAVLYLLAILFIAGGAFYLKTQTNTSINGNNVINVNDITGDAQIITLSVKNGNYYPEVIRVKKDLPAKIIVDLNKVRGCLTSIMIPAFGIRKRVVPGDNIIEFTPTKKGEFPFSCSMGMGTGTIIVE